MEFKACQGFQGYFTEKFKAIFSDEKHKNHCKIAPPSGRVRSSHDYVHVMRYLRNLLVCVCVLGADRGSRLLVNVLGADRGSRLLVCVRVC